MAVDEPISGLPWAQLQSLIDTFTEQATVLDQRGDIVMVNQSWVDCGASADSADPRSCLGRNYLDICRVAADGGVKDMPEVIAALSEVLAAETEGFVMEYDASNDGHSRRFQMRASSVVCDEVTWTLLVHRPLVADRPAHGIDRRQLESLGVLAGGIAHDFNNLLVAVLGNADLALNEMPLDALGRENVDQIREAAILAAELTNQMLAFSGKGQCVVEPIDLSLLVSQMTEELNATLPPSARVAYDLARDLDTITADRRQLRQLLTALVHNASEALEDAGGMVVVRTTAVVATTAELIDTVLNDDLPPGPYAVLEVTDTGCGMDSQTQAKIFEPFFTTKFTGRGLGLAAVLGIVRGHRGAIQVRSRPQMGSTFRILLPLEGSG